MDDEKYPRSASRECRNLSNVDCVNQWYKLSKEERQKHGRVMKIYLLSPMIFGTVFQEDRWINWACYCDLLPSNTNFEVTTPIKSLFEVIDMIEDAFDRMLEYLEPRSEDELVKIFDLMVKVNTFEDLEKAITCAESFPVFLKMREKILTGGSKGTKGNRGSLLLLLAQNQVYDHIKQLVVHNVDLVYKFEKTCADEEEKIREKQVEGNEHYMKGKYCAAIASYNSGLRLGTYSYILYGNRAQSYLKTNNFECALLDGRRAVLLKPDWHKGQFRYAQAFFELGMHTRAMEVNRIAKKICSANGKDLDAQYEKFSQKARRRANAVERSAPADLPQLVDADPSDSSGSDGERDSDDNSSSSHMDMPGLTSCSSDESDSDNTSKPNKKIDMEGLKEKLQKRDRIRAMEDKETKRREKAEAEKAKKQEEEKKAAAKEKKAKMRKQKQVKQFKQNGAEVDQKKSNLRTTLKQGSNALMITNSFRSAVHYYKEALEIITETNYQFYEMKEVDYILLLYAHGTACLGTGIHEELLEAIHQFERIRSDHTSIKFPLAYYGLGRVYHRQNRFFEALEPLEKGLELVSNLGKEHRVYKWPGSDIVIDETNPGELKVAIQAIITVCRNPPKPDAVCRFLECNGKTQIFLTDPDYKGFVRLICHEACRVEFHPVCWKKEKSNDVEKSGDRDFINERCMTPDCHGLITKIQIFDVSGLKTEFKSEKPIAKAEPKGRNNKGKERTIQTPKQQKQEKWKQEKEEAKPTPPDDKDTVPAEEKQEKSTSTPTTQKDGEEDYISKTQEPEELAESAEDQFVVPPDSKVFILRKGDPEERLQGAQSKISGKLKTKKKKPKQTQSLGEFLNCDQAPRDPYRPDTLDTFEDCGDIHENPRNRISPPYGSNGREPLPPSTFIVPFHLQDEHRALEESFESQSPACAATEEAVLTYVTTFIEEILNVYGSMVISDPNLVHALSLLSDTSQEMITAVGGIKQFLLKSGRFLFDGNVIMLQEDCPFNDAVAKSKLFNLGTYEQITNPRMENPPPGLDKLPDSGNDGIDAEEKAWLSQTISHCPTFNPNAKEFYPARSPSPKSTEFGEANAGAVSKNANASEVGEQNNVNNHEVINHDCNEATKTKDQLDSSSVREQEYLTSGAPVVQHREMQLLASKANGSNTNSESDKQCATVKPEGTAEDDFLDVDNSKLKGAPVLVVDKTGVNGCANGAGCNGLKENGQDGKLDKSLTSKLPNGKVAGGGSDVFVSQKSKAVQTQPMVKSKGVMTDSQQDQYKVDYTKVVGERDTLQEKLKGFTDQLKANSQVVERITKKLTNAHQENKDLSAKLEKETKAKEEQMEKLEQTGQHTKIQINILEQQKQEAEDRFDAVVPNLRKELAAAKAHLQREREAWMTEKAQKEESSQSLSTQCQQQKNRAQDAEVKLLELRRDVGLRFLERAFQESRLTHTHLVQALNTRISGPPPNQKLEEMANKWKTYATECQQRIHQCQASFDEQIQLLRSGQPLSGLSQLPIAGPPQYPGPPILQPLVSQVQGQQHPQPLENTVLLQPQFQAQALPAQSTQKLPRPHTPGPVGVGQYQLGPSAVPTSGAQAHPTVGAVESQVTVMGGAPAAENKSKPSNSFEKIMLRLSTMYPTLTRLELTGFIKQVRQNKHGSLTGLSLEDIVANVAELVVQKSKVGVLSSSAPAHAAPPRPAPGPVSVSAAKATVGTVPAQAYLIERPNTPTKAGKSVHAYEDDPCVICHEDMNGCDGVTQLECGHKYHTACIRKWLLGEQSTCPTCRVHALLPDEFPKLNR